METTTSKVKTPMECLECGNKFSKTIRPSTVEVKCPKCGGFDTEVNYL